MVKSYNALPNDIKKLLVPPWPFYVSSTGEKKPTQVQPLK